MEKLTLVIVPRVTSSMARLRGVARANFDCSVILNKYKDKAKDNDKKMTKTKTLQTNKDRATSDG